MTRETSCRAGSPSASQQRFGDLLELANVGPAIADRMTRIGITAIDQLRGRDAIELYEQMEDAAGHREDPCLLDTVLSAIDQADGKPARAWWSYTEDRKRLLAERSSDAR